MFRMVVSGIWDNVLISSSFQKRVMVYDVECRSLVITGFGRF